MTWAPDYCSTPELKDILNIGDGDDDTAIGNAIAAASRAIDRAANRQFGVVDVAEAREYETRWDRRRSVYVVETDDLMTDTGLVITDSNGNVVANSDIKLYPRNAPQKGRPWEWFTLSSATSELTVVASWGWTSIPTTIVEAATLQAERFFKRKDAPFGVAGSPDQGSEMRLLAKVDPDVEVMVGAYKRWWAAV